MIYNIIKNINMKNIINNNISKITQLSFNRNLSCHNLQNHINNSYLYRNTVNKYIDDYYDIENYDKNNYYNNDCLEQTINICYLCNGYGIVIKKTNKSTITNDKRYISSYTPKQYIEYETCKNCNGNGYI